MHSVLKKITRLVLADESVKPLMRVRRKDRPAKRLTERELIQLESQIGATIFGEKPANVRRREFFNLDEKTWIWYEEVIDAQGKVQELTTKYEVQNSGILKVQPNYQYSYLEGEELNNFVLAVKEYYERVSRKMYIREPSVG